MKYFYVRVSATIFIVTIIVLFAIYGFYKEYFLTAVFLVLVASIIMSNLIGFCNKINKDVKFFIQNMDRKEDNLEVNTTDYGAPFQLFFEAYNTILDNQKRLSEENYHLHQLLSTILNKTNTGFIVLPKNIKEDSTILYINNAAQDLLHIPQINSWQRITNKIPDFANHIENIKEGGKTFFSLNDGVELSIESQIILSDNQPLLLLTIQDIKSEMDQKETDSWNKLIQVMTHEILNSLTPINTMSFVLEKLSQKNILDEDDREDMQIASSTIVTRSKGLMQFVQDYRKVAALPIPQKTKIYLKPFLENIIRLFQKEITNAHISLDDTFDESSAVIWADQTQIEQVIVNLISNAVHAVSNQKTPTITIQILHQMDATQIIVKDNGKGIAVENQTQIFIPFFTTRPDGSGIGLSVVRNIMRMHHGKVSVQSLGENRGSVFMLTFPHKYGTF